MWSCNEQLVMADTTGKVTDSKVEVKSKMIHERGRKDLQGQFNGNSKNKGTVNRGKITYSRGLLL